MIARSIGSAVRPARSTSRLAPSSLTTKSSTRESRDRVPVLIDDTRVDRLLVRLRRERLRHGDGGDERQQQNDRAHPRDSFEKGQTHPGEGRDASLRGSIGPVPEGVKTACPQKLLQRLDL